MDKYYGNVCELDIIFNFQKAYFILDELLLAGEMQESSKKNVLKHIGQQDSMEDMEVSKSQTMALNLPQASRRILANSRTLPWKTTCRLSLGEWLSTMAVFPALHLLILHVLVQVQDDGVTKII